MRMVMGSNAHHDREALDKASHNPAYERRSMAALCQGTKQVTFIWMSNKGSWAHGLMAHGCNGGDCAMVKDLDLFSNHVAHT